MRSPLACIALTLLGSLGATCSPPPPAGTDLFVNAVASAPIGSLLSVWGSRTAVSPQAFLAGGFVGVDRALITDGVFGRLLEYGTGRFTTRCTADQPLWWTAGVEPDAGTGAPLTVFASGEGGRVIRYQNGQCTVLDTSSLGTGSMAPTFWGMVALAPDDLWLVGGSALPDGPRGVLVHYDGTHFVQQTGLPAGVSDNNLYKIARSTDGTLLVVGEGATVLSMAAGETAWSRVAVQGVRDADNRLFTVSCPVSGSICHAVGGTGSAVWVQLLPGALPPYALSPVTIDDLPGLNGVYVQDPRNTFVVGYNGFTLHFNGQSRYVPPRQATTATLHGVGGSLGVVLAVGGELGVNSATQHGVILVRGDSSASFTVDGVQYAPTGNLIPSLGGFGQH